jgi:hypothetical protein
MTTIMQYFTETNESLCDELFSAMKNASLKLYFLEHIHRIASLKASKLIDLAIYFLNLFSLSIIFFFKLNY